MTCQSNNATGPSPAIAPGSDSINPIQVAGQLGEQGMDRRVPAVVPGFDAPFFQAGLAGYSDAAMRIVARRHGCPFCVTEALLDRTLLAGGRGFTKADLGELHDNIPGGADDHPLACQIMGSDPAEMAAAALKAAEQGRRGEKAYRRLAYAGALAPGGTGFQPVGLQQAHGQDARATDRQHLRLPGGEQVGFYDPSALLDDPDSCDAIDSINTFDADASSSTSSLRHSVSASLAFQTIDVNLACPVKKIKNKARGGHWLAEPEGAIAILEAVRESVPKEVPCTVKLRRAFDDTPEMAANVDRILDAAERIGYAWATVHARTVEQKYIGPSRWTFLRELVVRHPGLSIFGSGDVWDVADIFRMLAYTGVSAVAVARGCIGNPWIFRQAREMMAGREPKAPTLAEQRTVLEDHFALAMRVNARMRDGESHTGRTMRKFAIRFAAHHPKAEEVRLAFIKVSGLDEWRAVLDEHYAPD